MGWGWRESERKLALENFMYGSGVGSEGSRLEAWMKSHKSAVAIT